MQLLAEHQGKKITPREGVPGVDYRCLDCSGIVRVRSRRGKPSYFFHVRPPPLCKKQGKSLAHLQQQLRLQNLFPSLELEKRFCEIGQIADGALVQEKIIFEVQCSVIPWESAQSRMEGYHSLGYLVVWLLDDRVFNRKKVSLFELEVRRRGGYYFRGDAIYDQHEVIVRGNRRYRSKPFRVDITRGIQKIERSLGKEVPVLLMERSWYFPGDFWDHWRGSKQSERYLLIEKRVARAFRERKWFWFYQRVLRRIFELTHLTVF